MTNEFESEIRQALDAKAYEVEVPSSLAAQTLERAAAVDVKQPLWERMKVRRDARRMRAPVTGYPRWLIGMGAIAGAASLVAVGTFVTMPTDGGPERAQSAPQPYSEKVEFRVDEDGRRVMDLPADKGTRSAVRGRSRAESGDASGTNSASQFVGLTAGSDTLVAGDILEGDATNVNSARAGAGGSAPDPQLVRSAQIRVAVGNFEDAWNDAHDLADDHGGKVINLRTSQGEEGVAEGTLRIRVPSDELDPLITDLRRLGTLASLETTGDDIADQIDATKKKLAAQKKAQQEAEERGTEAELARAEALAKDVKRLENKRNGLEEKVEFSFVSATLYQDEEAASRGATMIGTAARTSGRLALTVLAGTLVVAGVLAPLAILALVAWIVVRSLRRRRSS
jgi:hypothetical protein